GNIRWSGNTAEALLAEHPTADWVYIDPSRRADGRRVVLLESCSPDVIALRSVMLDCAPNVLIKAAPMLDLTLALSALPEVAHVAVISVGNECRELLFHLSRGHIGEPEVICLNRLSDGTVQEFMFHPSEERAVEMECVEPMAYLFEPNASVLKAGAFKLAAARFGLFRMDPSTHLYTGAAPVDGFPGRTFRVVRPLGKKESGLRAGVIVRNYPMRAEEVAKKYGIADGGDGYVVGFSSRRSKHLWLVVVEKGL
ncbi:MAG: SAM-dependent methyltransferase, partial [Bacteroidota bacterium]